VDDKTLILGKYDTCLITFTEEDDSTTGCILRLVECRVEQVRLEPYSVWQIPDPELEKKFEYALGKMKLLISQAKSCSLDEIDIKWELNSGNAAVMIVTIRRIHYVHVAQMSVGQLRRYVSRLMQTAIKAGQSPVQIGILKEPIKRTAPLAQEVSTSTAP